VSALADYGNSFDGALQVLVPAFVKPNRYFARISTSSYAASSFSAALPTIFAIQLVMGIPAPMPRLVAFSFE
jgi:hypothetical protein